MLFEYIYVKKLYFSTVLFAKVEIFSPGKCLRPYTMKIITKCHYLNTITYELSHQV